MGSAAPMWQVPLPLPSMVDSATPLRSAQNESLIVLPYSGPFPAQVWSHSALKSGAIWYLYLEPFRTQIWSHLVLVSGAFPNSNLELV